MRIGIVGAGITGLSAAYELTKKGHDVIIFERAKVPGGLGTYLKVGSTFIERFYHHFFSSDKYIIQMAKDLGVARKLHFYKAKTGIFSNKKVYPFSSAIDLLKFSPLRFIDRFRCGLLLAFLKFTPFPLYSLDKISAKNFIIKYAGSEVYKKIWGPLLEGKFSSFSSHIPALWLWGRVFDRSVQLGYFDGSVKVLFDKLVAFIKKKKGKVLLGAEITGIKDEINFVKVYTTKKEYIFDKVIITTVSPIAEKLIKNTLPRSYRSFLQSIDHLGAVCVILELKKSVQSQYWLNICEKNAPVLVVIEHTNFIDKKQYGNNRIMYLANYLHRESPRFKLTDQQILSEYTNILTQINPLFKKSWIKKSYVSRVPRAQTIFKLHANRTKPSIETPLKNIFMVNIDQMYPHDRNLNQGIELGKKVVQKILEINNEII